MSEPIGPGGPPPRRHDPPGRHVEDLVTPYALGALEPDERALVERHRRACPTCDRLLRDEGRFVSLLPFATQATIPPPPDVKIALFARVAHAQRPPADAAHQRLEATFPLAPSPTLPASRPTPTPAAVAATTAPPTSRGPLPRWGTRWATALLVLPLLLALAGTGTWAMQLRARADDSRDRASRFGALLEANLEGTGEVVQLFAGPAAPDARAWIIPDADRRTATLVMRHDDAPPNPRFRLVATIDDESRRLADIELDERGRGFATFLLGRPLTDYGNLRIKVEASNDSATDPDASGVVLRAAPGRPPATPDALPRP